MISELSGLLTILDALTLSRRVWVTLIVIQDEGMSEEIHGLNRCEYKFVLVYDIHNLYECLGNNSLVT